jgi:hypothetical protein
MPESKASLTFAESIKDAENLLAHFDALNTQPPPPETEVLKRAGLVMAMTAWETYVEDRIQEAAQERLQGLAGTAVAAYMKARLSDEIKRLHNPTSEKCLQLFKDFAGVDLIDAWRWNKETDSKATRKRLDDYIKLRGDVVHRSRKTEPGPPQAHPVTKIELLKAIRFLKDLVAVTEKALVPGQTRAVAPVTSVVP